MRESLIEADGVRYAIKRGWLVYKFASPNYRGVHDRIHFKDGVTFTIEYKTTGKKATPKQRAEAEKLRRARIPCRCIDNVQAAREFIDRMTDAAEADDPIFEILFLAANISSFES